MKHTGNKSEASILRQKAEGLLQNRPTKTASQLSESEILKLYHDLEVHDIELTLLNDELLLAKEQADETSRKYTELYDFAPSGYFTISREGKILELNLTGAQLLGQNRSGLINSSFQNFISEMTKPFFNLFLNKTFKGKTKQTCEVALSKDSNPQSYLHLTGIIAGKEEQCLITATDITNRVREEESLRQSEERYRAIFENNHSIMLLIDPENGAIKDVNSAACDYYGWSHNEFCRKNISEINTISDEEVKHEMFLAFKENRSYYFFKHRLKNGELRDVEVASGPVQFHGSTLLYSIVHDITDRKTAEIALKERELQYRQLADSGQALIWTATPDKKCNYFNQVWLNFTGRSIEQELGDGWAEGIHPDDLDRCLTIFSTSFDQRKSFSMEYRLRRHDGVYRWLLDDGTPSFNIHGTFIGYIGHCLDINEQKQAEDKLTAQTLLLTNLIINMEEGILLEDSDRKILLTNQLFCDMFGIPAPPAALIGSDCSESAEQSKHLFRSPAKFVADLEIILAEKKTVLNDVLELADGRSFERDYIPTYLDRQYTGHLWKYRDITEREQSENRLKESEGKFRNITEQTDDLIAIADKNGVIIYASSSSEALFHISPEEMCGRNFAEFVEDSDMNRALGEFSKCIQGLGRVQNAEFRLKRSDGSLFTGEVNASLFQTHPHDGVLVIVRNIDERKANEAALRKLSLAIEQSPVSIVITDLNGIIEYANAKACETSGYPLRELFGSNPRVLKSETTSSDDYKQLWDTIISGQEWKGVFHNKNKNGELYWESATISPISDNTGKITHYLAVKEDITERKQAEEALKTSEAALNYAQEIARMGSWEMDMINNKYWWSDNNYRLIGIQPGDMTVSIDLFKNMVYPDDLSLLNETVENSIMNKKAVTVDFRVVMPDGRIRWIENNIVPVFDRETLLSVKGINIDITEKKQAESEILRLNADLEETIKKRTLQLSETNENLEKEIGTRLLAELELDREKQRLASIIEGTDVGTWEWNIQTGETIFNERWAEIIGYTLDEISPVSIETWMKFAHPDDLKMSGELLEKHFAGESDHYTFESRMKHKNGTWVWVLDRGKVHSRDLEGKPLLMSGTHQDISERKRSAEFQTELLHLSVQVTGIPISEIPAALNHALKRIADFLSADRAYIFEIDLEENLMSNTYEWCRKGIQPEIETLQNIPCNHLPMWFDQFTRNEPLLIRSVNDLPETWSTEREHFTQQGIQSLILIPMLIDNRLDGFVGLDNVENKRDYTNSEINILKVWSNMLASLISHQKKEDLLEQTRRNYETFFNTIDDFLFVLGEKGDILHTNTTVTRRLGYDSEELMGQSVLMVHPPERREEAGRIVGEMLAGTAEFCPVPLVTKAGDYLSVETKVKPGFWDGKPVIFGVTKDVSKIKLSEEKFSKAFQLNGALVAISDFDGRFIDVNDTFLKTLGYSREEVIGNTSLSLQMFVDPASRAAAADSVKQGHPVKDLELLVKTKSGEIKVGLYSIDSIHIGKDLCLLTMMIDITERKQAEQAVLDSEIKQSTLISNISDVIGIMGVDGVMKYKSPNIEKYFGWQPNDLVGTNGWLTVHPKDQERLKTAFIDLLKKDNSSATVEYDYLCKDGSYKPIELTAINLVNNTVINGVLLNYHDITERKHAEAELLDSETRFSLFMDYLPAVVFLKDHEGRTLFVNQYMEDAFGASGWVGKTMLEVFPDELGEKLVSDDISSMQLGYQKIEEKLVQLDGKLHHYVTQKFTIDRPGKEPLLAGISLDITDRKRAEEEILKSKDEAEKANLAKSEFLSRMSHELRTPMNSILGFAQLLNMGELNPKQKKGINHILNSGKHLLGLIDEVLDISRIESGRLSLFPEPVLLSGIVAETIDTVQPLADARKLRLELVNSPATQLFVMTDKKLLKQVLINLLNNAIKYNTEGGSVKINMEALHPDDPHFGSVRIAVTDTGLGIPAEDIPKIFAPFERIGAEKSQTEGTGLGLAVVKKIMDAMEGAVGVESIVGAGSTFWIELPITEKQIRRESQKEINEKLTAMESKLLPNTGTILYVEDNVQNAELVDEIIRNYRPGIKLITSIYGNTAVTLATEHKPGLILLDLDLPDMEGIEVLINLMADESIKSIPVVIISADATQHQIEKLMSAGAKDYLTKPLDINLFLQTVDVWIVGRKNQEIVP